MDKILKYHGNSTITTTAMPCKPWKKVVVNVYVEDYKPSSRKQFNLPIEKLIIENVIL